MVLRFFGFGAEGCLPANWRQIGCEIGRMLSNAFRSSAVRLAAGMPLVSFSMISGWQLMKFAHVA